MIAIVAIVAIVAVVVLIKTSGNTQQNDAANFAGQASGTIESNCRGCAKLH